MSEVSSEDEPSRESDIPLATSSNYANAGIEIEITPKCRDCTDDDGEFGVEMEALDFDDAVDYGIVYRCPSCGKTYTLGKYGNGSLKEQLAGDESEKDPGRPCHRKHESQIPGGELR